MPALPESRVVAFSSCRNFLRGRRRASAPFGECRMKHSQNAGESGPAAVRTSELVPTSGIWRNHCSRPGCEFIEDLVLAAGAPAPPCRHCCNSSQLTYLGPAPTVLDETREGTIVGPRHFTMRVRGIV